MRWLLLVALVGVLGCQDNFEAPECATSDECRYAGTCTAKDGKCIATKDADCAKSALCKTDGHCSATLNGECKARKDADCTESDACKNAGQCSVQENYCRALSDADCANSYGCLEKNWCEAYHGKCVE